MHQSSIFIALFVSLLWGISPIISKILITKYDKTSIFILSGMIYSIFMVIFFCFNRKVVAKDVAKMSMRDIILLFFEVLLTSFVANLVYYYILEHHDSYLVTSFVSVSPLFTLVLAYLFLKENITFMSIIGTVMIVLGIIIISINDTKYVLLNENFYV